MGKNIIVCNDGTWNGPGQDEDGDGVPDTTNVVKLFACLAGQVTLQSTQVLNEQEKVATDGKGGTLQVAKYLHGVGDDRNKLKRLLGGVVGAGVIDRVVRGYSYVSRQYEPGDQIYLCGFSRGAYTSRALGGLIGSVGLLNRDAVDMDDADARYKLGIGAWVRYRLAAKKASPLFPYLLSFVGTRVEDRHLRPNVPIRAIGVWDTVGSYGLPAYTTDGERRDLFAFADCKLGSKVKQGFHAVSIDERRADFTPTLWDDDPRVDQVWFAGAHADVGGGYPKVGMSDIALGWMIERLKSAGVLFDNPASYALRHDLKVDTHMPWAADPWRKLAQAPRTVPRGASIHGSVIQRGRYDSGALKALLKGNAIDLQACKVIEWKA